LGWEEAPPKEKVGVPGLNVLLCAGAWLVESDPPPKLNEGVALAPNVKDAEPGWAASLPPPLPKLKEVGADEVPPEANGLLNEVSPPPAEKLKEAPPPVPKMDPLPAGWVVGCEAAGVWEPPKLKMEPDEAGPAAGAALPKIGFAVSVCPVGAAPKSGFAGATCAAAALPKRGFCS
jgi:hypothetical protein